MSVVYALATPAARSAICVFRVSGKGCLDRLSVLFGDVSIPPRVFLLGLFIILVFLLILLVSWFLVVGKVIQGRTLLRFMPMVAWG